ncbi:MAG: GGDEF domain-containing protein [Elusimicrobiota bacterium]
MSRAGRAWNFALALVGPFGFPLASGLILWLMVRSPLPAASLFPAFAVPVIFLYFGAGPVWSLASAIFAALVGLLGFAFTHDAAPRIVFAAGVPFVFAVYLSLSALDRRCRAARNARREENDRLELELARLQWNGRQVRAEIDDCRERISAYGRLQLFIDDLIGAYSRSELLEKAQAGLETMFPKARVSLRLFPAPDRPEPDDAWGHRALSAARPRLFPSRKSAVPSWKSGSFVFIPVRVHESAVGWFGLDAKRQEGLQAPVVGLAAIASDLISIALGNAELFARTEAMAISDSLTGLYTRGHFNERLGEEFLSARHRSAPLSLLLVDIDHFKAVNDTYGHETGDEVLRWLAKFVLSQARETDFVARYGGEELAVVMPRTGKSEAADFARRLCRNLAASPFRWGGRSIAVTLSGGVAALAPEIAGATDLIRCADEALYRAKREGRNRVEIF